MLTDPVREEPGDPLKGIANCYRCRIEKDLIYGGLAFCRWLDFVKDKSRSVHDRRSIRLKMLSPKGQRYAY